MVIRPGTYWVCSDFEGYRFYLWQVCGGFAYLHDAARQCHVSVPVSSLGRRWVLLAWAEEVAQPERRLELAINVLEFGHGGKWSRAAVVTAATLRAENLHDPVVLEALDRLERGETKSELVGFARLEVA